MRFKQTITSKEARDTGTVAATFVFHASSWEVAARLGLRHAETNGMDGPSYSSVVTYDDDNAEEAAARARRQVLIEQGIPAHEARKMDEFEQSLKNGSGRVSYQSTKGEK